MAKLTKDQVRDFKVFFNEAGDPGFSPERNKQVIEDSIKAYDAKRAQMQKFFAERLDERADAVSSLLKAIDRGKDTDAVKFFGKKELARLRGEQIIGEFRLRAAAMQRKFHA